MLETTTANEHNIYLSELRKIDVTNNLNEVEQKLAELFSAEEITDSFDLLDDDLKINQKKIREEVVTLRKFVEENIEENIKQKQKIDDIIDAVKNTIRYKEDLIKCVPEGFEVLEQVSKLNEYSQILTLIDSLNGQDTPFEETLLKLSDYLNRYGISYNFDSIRSYFSPSIIDKFVRKINRRKREEVLTQFNQSLLELKKEVISKLTILAEQIRTNVNKAIDIVVSDEKLEFFEQNVKKLLQASIFISSKDYKAPIPIEIIQLKEDLSAHFSEGIDQLISFHSEEGKKLLDNSSLAEITTKRLLSSLEQASIVLPILRKEILSLLNYLYENTQVDKNKIDEIKTSVEEKKLVLFLIKNPEMLRKGLYNIYKDLDKPKKEKRRFLKMAVQLLEELTESQTEAFLEGYQEIWKIFANAGFNKIELTTLEIKKLFLKKGYEISSSNKVDFVESLVLAKENHNEIIRILTEEFGTNITGNDEIGKEMFTALCSRETLPYGKVELDLTSPISSIRLVCYDLRDYNFLAGHINHEEYKNNSLAQEIYSGGVSYSERAQFTLQNGNKYELPVIVVNESIDSSNRIEIVEHEDAHKAIIVDQENLQLSSERRETKSFSDEFSFENFDMDDNNGKDFIDNWRNEIKSQLNLAITRMRDETQAYLTNGDSTKNIERYLSGQDGIKLYDYVGNYNYKSKKLNEISDNFSNNSLKSLLEQRFAKDVEEAREAYNNFRKAFLAKVDKLLNLFLVDDTDITAKKKVALLVRHTTPKEFMYITRYLGRTEKSKNSKNKSPNLTVQYS